MSDSFHVTVLSQSDLTEFPKNVANSFKNRLANPLFLTGDGWKVGLASISLPDARVSIEPLLQGHRGDHLMALTWYYRSINTEKQGNPLEYSTEQKKNIWVKDVSDDENIIDGVSFMKSIIYKADTFRVASYKNGYAIYDDDVHPLFLEFNWLQNGDLLIDNENTAKGRKAGIRFSAELAKKMKWVEWNASTKKWLLGQNLLMEHYQETALQEPSDLNSGTEQSPKPVYWYVDDWSLRLSVFCNWRFINLNKAFHNVIGNSTRTFHVYSDVCASTLVGNKVKDLLREVRYKREGRGAVYFELLHIQYIPVRNHIIETIEAEVSESETGYLVNFGKGEGILTLHFKKDSA